MQVPDFYGAFRTKLYILYHTKLEKEQNLEKIRLYEANDRANLFVDQKPLVTLYDRQLLSEAKAGEDFAKEDGKPVTFKKGAPLDILVENMGRVNFGPRMEHQRKGTDQRSHSLKLGRVLPAA
mgnify:CR=1 FL=1